MDTKYMINFPPFVCVADIGSFSDTRSYYGHMANSYLPGVNMKQKQNAKFAYDKRFCIDPITLQKTPVQMPGTIGIIPVCATKDINRADEVIVKYCTGSTGYIINTSYNANVRFHLYRSLTRSLRETNVHPAEAHKKSNNVLSCCYF